MPAFIFSTFFFYTMLYCFFFFFFNDTATTEIYTLSLHDALPISFSFHVRARLRCALMNSETKGLAGFSRRSTIEPRCAIQLDRKSTRLNSSHLVISYAVFCLKKKKTK